MPSYCDSWLFLEILQDYIFDDFWVQSLIFSDWKTVIEVSSGREKEQWKVHSKKSLM